MAHKVTLTVEAFFHRYPRISFKKGTLLIGADENPTGISFIGKGFVKQYVISPKGQALMLAIFKPGAFIPLTWGINETPNASNFESLTDVTLYRAPPEAVITFLREHPDVLYNCTQRLLAGLSGMLERLQMLALDDAYEKVVRVLVYFGKLHIPFPLPHKEIAAWTGLARETVSLQMEKLIHRGLIRYNGRTLEVVNLTKLSQEETR
ncbi:Crp/Fnr family transcriptional regulator [Candidatus Gottesmanbacteria bacterium]|nr:Crp/Fnr family transcriptional regulator [Candidatus Gottesmanbacteria bacterium]